jgi:hypothetical protein
MRFGYPVELKWHWGDRVVMNWRLVCTLNVPSSEREQNAARGYNQR